MCSVKRMKARTCLEWQTREGNEERDLLPLAEMRKPASLEHRDRLERPERRHSVGQDLPFNPRATPEPLP